MKGMGEHRLRGGREKKEEEKRGGSEAAWGQ